MKQVFPGHNGHFYFNICCIPCRLRDRSAFFYVKVDSRIRWTIFFLEVVNWYWTAWLRKLLCRWYFFICDSEFLLWETQNIILLKKQKVIDSLSIRLHVFMAVTGRFPCGEKRQSGSLPGISVFFVFTEKGEATKAIEQRAALSQKTTAAPILKY